MSASGMCFILELAFAAVISSIFALSAADENLTCSGASRTCSNGRDHIMLQHAHSHYGALQLGVNTSSSLGDRCTHNSQCVVPAGERWVFDAGVDIDTLTVRGSLIWNTAIDGLELRACHIMVEDGGLFQVGTSDAPMLLGATIYLKRCAAKSPVGVQFLAAQSNARIEIHGRPLGRTMTLLAATAASGSSRITLKHDPSGMGWRIGDEIGVATTNARRGDSTKHRITALAGSILTIDPPLRNEHMGGFKTIEGHNFEMAAEVVNMKRSILITGDHNNFHATGQGLTTMIMGKGSVGVFRYTRVEYCGQNNVVGRYCLHFHLNGQCPECVFQGNAVVDSFQSGITIHGTHNSLTDSNVLWQNRGVGIYVEDGNEMNNVISKNVIICEVWKDEFRRGGPQGPTCIVKGANAGEGVGIYVVGMTNDLIDNHVVGMQHGLFTPGNLHHLGQGAAYGKVCPKHLPYGTFRGNVCHDCSYFGTYPDNQYPRNVGERDEDGYVVDMDKCWQEVTPDGKDNGVVPASKVEDGFDWHNDFVGQYTAGDIAYVRFTAVDCNTGMYWKRSKNFADPTAWHISDSVFADTTARLPGGPFTFAMKNVKVVGSAQLHSPQHCFSAPDDELGMTCNVQNLFEKLDSTSVYPHLRDTSQVIGFGSSGGDPVKILWLAKDNSLDGYGAIVSPYLDGFKHVSGCAGPLKKWGGGYGCDKNTPVRRLNIFTGTNMGRITIKGPGYERVPSNGAEPVYGMNAGSLWWTSPWHDPAGQYTDRGSYAAPVVAGQRYTITGLEWRPDDKQPGDIIIEFSDLQTSQRLGSADELVLLTLQTSRGTVDCVATASADRSFSTPAQGPESGGALGDCGEKFRALAGQPATSVIERAHRRRAQRTQSAGAPAAGGGGGGAVVPSATSVCSDASISDDNGSPQLAGVCLNMLSSTLQSADEYTFCGETIRTDGGLNVCNDCAVRCWLQMSGECVGVVMEYNEGSTTSGSCTYFSRIDNIVHSRSGVAAIAKAGSFPAVPQPDLSPAPVPKTPEPSLAPTPAPTISPTPLSTPVPVQTPTLLPTSLSTGSSASVQQVCSDRSDLPSQLQAAEGYTLRGTAMHTDGGVSLCNDCAVRCWLMMSSECVGFVMKYYEGSTRGSCTYFSAIDSVVPEGDGTAITTPEFLSILPTQAATPRPTQASMPASTPAVTPIPTSISEDTPAPSPRTPLPTTSPVSAQQVCSDRSDLPSQLQAAEGYTLRGTAMHTDGGVNVCNDCAVRCWLMMSSKCVGFVMKYDEGSTRGSCTYFSDIDSVVPEGDGTAVTTPEFFSSELTPDSTSEHACGADESCSGHVRWAMDTGIKQNPEWYPGLSSASSFRDFHKSFYDGQVSANGIRHCALPPCENR